MTGWLGGLEFGIRGRVSYGVLQVTQDSRFRKFQVPSDNHLDDADSSLSISRIYSPYGHCLFFAVSFIIRTSPLKEVSLCQP